MLPSMLFSFREYIVNVGSIGKLQLFNFVFMLIYCSVFAALGYRLALKRHKNILFWTIICGVTGFWGWLYLYLKKR
jgi:hypothetical protein